MGLFDGLPSGWFSAKDAKGVTYYYNRSTGENTYTKPGKGGASAPVVPAGAASRSVNGDSASSAVHAASIFLATHTPSH